LKTSGNDFGDACLLFNKERKQKIKYYQQLTRLLTPFFQSEGVARNLVLPMLPRLPIARGQMLRTLSGFQNGWI
jgi:2-polyprenyl-6-methoxyphenol hydroxylase-like FAD-dependent oxidoreductase